MTKAEFAARFGGVFEHSSWIAERAYDADGDAAGKAAAAADRDAVHACLCRQFRDAHPDERLGVLRAHPDLAGKLALSGGLTAASAGEQASAGLDQLNAEELAAMTALNLRYQEKFGFPFIIAVKGLDKTQIQKAFAARVENDAETEFAAACDQVEKIALLRLSQMFAC